jgi:hypothetical protein
MQKTGADVSYQADAALPASDQERSKDPGSNLIYSIFSSLVL